MRNRLLTLAIACAAALTFAIASVGAAVPGSSYQWQQPGTAPVTTPYAQPELQYTAVPVLGAQYAHLGYSWAQPGTAPVSTPHAQP
jgi:hypothetical protein